eukprot:c22073_g1_i1.p1 GENE.c22073_g1_i1~~c22073_g1_i1.p1  ORF type:complete len:221 (-),score=84.79 c22073_g1_i1:90-752(-)
MNCLRVFVFVFTLTVIAVIGQDQDRAGDVASTEEQVATNGALEGIHVYSVFPGFSDKFPLGQYHTQLVGIKNNADVPVNVTAITGSLLSPFDLNYFVQNFTAMELGLVVEPGHSISVLYRYAPYTTLEPTFYALATWLHYHTAKTEHVSTIFNQTIELYEPTTEFDPKQTFIYVAGLAVTALAGFFGYQYFNAQNKKNSRKNAKSSDKAQKKEKKTSKTQ